MHTRPTTAAGLLEAHERGSIPARTVVVTFDDGYADLATEVRPRLERAGVPATMFLVSRAIGRQTAVLVGCARAGSLGVHRSGPSRCG